MKEKKKREFCQAFVELDLEDGLHVRFSDNLEQDELTQPVGFNIPEMQMGSLLDSITQAGSPFWMILPSCLGRGYCYLVAKFLVLYFSFHVGWPPRIADVSGAGRERDYKFDRLGPEQLCHVRRMMHSGAKGTWPSVPVLIFAGQ